MVGLPYPNIYSPELKEKMTYLDSTLGVSFSLCFDYFCQNRREITLSRRWTGAQLCLFHRVLKKSSRSQFLGILFLSVQYIVTN